MLIPIGDMVDPNDPQKRTIREINRTIPHNIPLGTLVEVKWDEWFGDGACEKVHARLWVVAHSRDCDGSPLYILSRWKDFNFAKMVRQYHGGFSEESLTIVPLTPGTIRGDDALAWDDA